MNALRYLALILDVAHFTTLLYFVLPLKWSYEADRMSIVGFGMMLGAIALNMLLLIFARF